MQPDVPPLGRWTRLSLALLALGLVGLLGLSRRLEPDPRGFGTHLQLGLAPCVFREAAGYPCPTCGVTTAFAWFARGQFGPAWRANPGGLALAAACLALVPWLAGSAARGNPWPTRSAQGPLAGLLLAIAAWTVLAWFFRLIFTWRVMG
jgi:hypothetical protein